MAVTRSNFVLPIKTFTFCGVIMYLFRKSVICDTVAVA
jgi:hypothetical protein